MQLTVLISTHNPHPERLQRVLASLQVQTLPVSKWQTILVDNASSPALSPTEPSTTSVSNLRLVQEPQLGLTAARRCGFHETKQGIVVLVDDDNVLAPDYLEQTLAVFERLPMVGAIGGKSHPSFETEPPAWTNEFFPLLALRDLGETELIFSPNNKDDRSPREYPSFAPIGAGMALRREAISAWLESNTQLSDRRGSDLTSSGDNDMVFSIMKSGWEIAYIPKLKLTHIIPAGRLAPDYLARLNRGIQRSWVRVLAKHDACPWLAIPRWTLPLRILRARLRAREWQGPMQRVRAAGLIGRLEGQADISV